MKITIYLVIILLKQTANK